MEEEVKVWMYVVHYRIGICDKFPGLRYRRGIDRKLSCVIDKLTGPFTGWRQEVCSNAV